MSRISTRLEINLILSKENLEIVIIFNDRFFKKIYNLDNLIKYKIFRFNYYTLEIF